jgi:predicted O-linked N-acetylglucosamine transferase (SPINDLY family)
MNNSEEAYQQLSQENYLEASQLYERAIELEPENITNYWYLGLTHLLQGKQEEAQTIWFYVFSQLDGEETEIYTHDLVEILITEAQRQENSHQDYLAWLLRGQIRELAPNLLDNLLALVKLELQLKTFNFKKVQAWNLIELIKQNDSENIDLKLLEDVLREILNFPTEYSVEFADVCLEKTEGSGNFVRTIVARANKAYYGEQIKFYAIDLIKKCLNYHPHSLYLLQIIFWDQIGTDDLFPALDYAKRFFQNCQKKYQKLVGNYMVLYSHLTMGNWLEVEELIKHHKQLLNETILEEAKIEELYIQETFLVVTSILLYIQDSPPENRLLINQFSRYFQNSCQRITSYPLNQFKHKNKAKLRLGYIGYGLKQHSVGWLSRWLIHHHNREEFEIFIYSISGKETEFSKKWFTDKVDRIYYLSTDTNQIVTQIEQDQIDILIDVDSLTRNNTCNVMALKPAPIQITWLGFDASGIPAIDYFIADPYVLPENAQDYYQEKIWRLPHTYLAIDGFEVGIPSLTRKDLDIPPDAVVYYNIQSALKSNPSHIQLQMQILKAVPHSYLLIKGTGNQESREKLFREIANSENVSFSRLKFLERTATEENHRANLRIADVVLDTYPYNGATTTLETLWMGIPLVTRVGEQFAARNSYGFMINVGVTEGIAWSDQEYVEWGIRLGTDQQLRQKIAWKLRKSRHTSPLWNGKQFAKEMEKAYQQMWQIYLES